MKASMNRRGAKDAEVESRRPQEMRTAESAGPSWIQLADSAVRVSCEIHELTMNRPADNGTARLPNDHAERMKRVLLSLDGLSVGDGFGESFFTSSTIIKRVPRTA